MAAAGESSLTGGKQGSGAGGKGSNTMEVKSLDMLTTTERIAALGTDLEERMAAQKKQQAEAARHKKPDYLNETREGLLTRWRNAFEEIKGSRDRGLMQTLVSRAEARDRVYESPELLDTALQLATKELMRKAKSLTTLRAASIRSSSAASLLLDPMAAAEGQGTSIWHRAKKTHERRMARSASLGSLAAGRSRADSGASLSYMLRTPTAPHSYATDLRPPSTAASEPPGVGAASTQQHGDASSPQQPQQIVISISPADDTAAVKDRTFLTNAPTGGVRTF